MNSRADDPREERGAVDMSDAEATCRETVRALLDVAGGVGEVREAEHFLDERVRMHLDGLHVRGRRKWRAFLTYVRHRRVMAGLQLRCERIVVLGDVATYHGSWWGLGGARSVGRVTARFRFRGTRIVEIWSCRENYVPLFGEQFRGSCGFWLTAVRGGVWWCLRGRAD